MVFSMFLNIIYWFFTIQTNISLSQFGPLGGPESSLISLKSIGNIKARSLQIQEIANHLSKGSNGVMQTTIYKFLPNTKSIYRIQIHVDGKSWWFELNRPLSFLLYWFSIYLPHYFIFKIYFPSNQKQGTRFGTMVIVYWNDGLWDLLEKIRHRQTSID